jgi:hypothetical protein
MITITKDFKTIDNAIDKYRGMAGDGDLQDWINQEGNLAFVDDLGNVGILHKDSPGVYDSHIFFKSRGREAIQRAKEMMAFGFDETDCIVMRGYTPVYNKAARWINRQLGYTSYGVLSQLNPPCELFIVTKQEFHKTFGAKNEQFFRR